MVKRLDERAQDLIKLFSEEYDSRLFEEIIEHSSREAAIVLDMLTNRIEATEEEAVMFFLTRDLSEDITPLAIASNTYKEAINLIELGKELWSIAISYNSELNDRDRYALFMPEDE